MRYNLPVRAVRLGKAQLLIMPVDTDRSDDTRDRRKDPVILDIGVGIEGRSYSGNVGHFLTALGDQSELRAMGWQLNAFERRYFFKVLKRHAAPAHGRPPVIAASGQELNDAPAPPAIAERLLHLLLPHGKGEALIGDLQEEFGRYAVTKFGTFHARLWYWSQTVRSLAHYAVFAYVLEHLRKFIQTW